MAFAAVNINSATKAQLESLSGIGPVRAQAIIDYRAKNGPFKSIDDVKKVNGVGDATFDKIKGDISLSGTTVPVKGETKTEKVEKKVDAAADKTKEKAKETEAAVKEKASDAKADTKAAAATVAQKGSSAPRPCFMASLRPRFSASAPRSAASLRPRFSASVPSLRPRFSASAPRSVASMRPRSRA